MTRSNIRSLLVSVTSIGKKIGKNEVVIILHAIFALKNDKNKLCENERTYLDFWSLSVW